MLSLDIDTLTARFLDNFECDLPITYDLQPLADYPEGRVHFAVRPGASRHLYGNRTSGAKAQTGRVWLWVYVPDQQGDAQAVTIMDDFAAIFRNWTDGVIRCETEDFSPIVVDKGDARFGVSVFWESVRPYENG